MTLGARCVVRSIPRRPTSPFLVCASNPPAIPTSPFLVCASNPPASKLPRHERQATSGLPPGACASGQISECKAVAGEKVAVRLFGLINPAKAILE